MIRVMTVLDGNSSKPVIAHFENGLDGAEQLKDYIRRGGFNDGFVYGRKIQILIRDDTRGVYLEADGTECVKQDTPQWRNMEVDVRVGNKRV